MKDFITKDEVQELKTKHAQAVQDKAKCFRLDGGQELNTSYAGYLLEYIATL